MRDDQDRHAARAIQILEKREDGGLAGDVHAGRRFVQDEHVRLGGERPGQEHALLLAT